MSRLGIFLRRSLFLLAASLLTFAATASSQPGESSLAKHRRPREHRMVVVPEEDRFTPFSLEIRAGDVVEWVNNDGDDHTVVSDTPFDTTGPKHLDQLLPGTESNGGQPAPPFRLRFEHAGVFVYYCRFHAHLDGEHQPVAPGPDAGIQGEKDPSLCDPPGADTCNFGTPMMGVITVLPRGEHGGDDD